MSEAERYDRVARLLDTWANEPGDFDIRVGKQIDAAIQERHPMTHANAEVVSMHEPKRMEFVSLFVMETRYPSDSALSLPTPDLATAEMWAKCSVSFGKRCRILRLPSEHEAALQPLEEAVNKAAIKYAESQCAHDRHDYFAACNALAAARKEKPC